MALLFFQSRRNFQRKLGRNWKLSRILKVNQHMHTIFLGKRWSKDISERERRISLLKRCQLWTNIVLCANTFILSGCSIFWCLGYFLLKTHFAKLQLGGKPETKSEARITAIPFHIRIGRILIHP